MSSVRSGLVHVSCEQPATLAVRQRKRVRRGLVVCSRALVASGARAHDHLWDPRPDAPVRFAREALPPPAAPPSARLSHRLRARRFHYAALVAHAGRLHSQTPLAAHHSSGPGHYRANARNVRICSNSILYTLANIVPSYLYSYDVLVCGHCKYNAFCGTCIRYYSLDDSVLRELLGKKLTSRERRELEDLEETGQGRIRSSRRQVCICYFLLLGALAYDCIFTYLHIYKVCACTVCTVTEIIGPDWFIGNLLRAIINLRNCE